MRTIPLSKSLRGAHVDFVPGGGGPALVLSMRRAADFVGYVAMYEFEDLAAALLGADLGEFGEVEGLELSRIAYKIARGLTRSADLAEAVQIVPNAVPLGRDYELLLAVFNHPHELYALSALRGWRDRCRVAVCYLCEAWDTRLPVYLLELLRHFDHVFIGVRGSVGAIATITGRPCSYLPMGVDALGFCPYPEQPARLIDICGIGRRSPITHAALVAEASKKRLFYYYDTTHAGPNVTFRVSNPREHRVLYGNLLKRSKYFIANRAWADHPSVTGGKDEIAARFYEGAAAGTVMVGDPPASDDFREQFGWENAVVRVPFDAPAIADVLAELESDVARASRIRRDSVINALLRHDWVYRLRTILDVAGLKPTPAMLEREAALRERAEGVHRTTEPIR